MRQISWTLFVTARISFLQLLLIYFKVIKQEHGSAHLVLIKTSINWARKGHLCISWYCTCIHNNWIWVSTIITRLLQRAKGQSTILLPRNRKVTRSCNYIHLKFPVIWLVNSAGIILTICPHNRLSPYMPYIVLHVLCSLCKFCIVHIDVHFPLTLPVIFTRHTSAK